MFRPTAFRSVVPSTAGSVSAAWFEHGADLPGELLHRQSQFVTDSTTTPATPKPHFLEISNGTSAGRARWMLYRTQRTPSRWLRMFPRCITAGTTTVKVRPHWTFGTAFGATNSAGFQGGPTAYRGGQRFRYLESADRCLHDVFLQLHVASWMADRRHRRHQLSYHSARQLAFKSSAS